MTSTIKAQLGAKREEVREELRHLTEVSPSTAPSANGRFEPQDWGEASVEANETEDEWVLRSNQQALLGEIEAALARLEAGTYGICIVCHRPIPEKRLQILPWAARDVQCQEQFEREKLT